MTGPQFLTFKTVCARTQKHHTGFASSRSPTRYYYSSHVFRRSDHVHAETEPRIPLSPANTSLPPFARSTSPPPPATVGPLLPTPLDRHFFFSPRDSREETRIRGRRPYDFRVENRGVGRGDRGRGKRARRNPVFAW